MSGPSATCPGCPGQGHLCAAHVSGLQGRPCPGCAGHVSAVRAVRATCPGRVRARRPPVRATRPGQATCRPGVRAPGPATSWMLSPPPLSVRPGSLQTLAKRVYIMPAAAPRHQAFASSARKFGAATSLPQSAGLLLCRHSQVRTRMPMKFGGRCDMLGHQTADAEPAQRQACDIAFLPASLGGLGLMHAERLSPAAYWAAWADASPMLQQRCPRRRGLPSRSRAPSLQAAAAAGVHLEGQGWGQRPGWEACLRTAAPQAARSEPGQLVGKGVLLSQEQVSESGQCLRCPQPKATYRQQRSSSSQLTRHPAGCRCDEALKDRCWPLAFRCCHAWDLDCRRAIGKQAR